MDNFENTLRQQLLAAEQQLDDSTLRRLRQARTTALTTTRRSLLPRLKVPRLMVPALGMVTASVVALVLVMTPLGEQAGLDSVGPDNAAFYQDLEFYYWLAENESARKS